MVKQLTAIFGLFVLAAAQSSTGEKDVTVTVTGIETVTHCGSVVGNSTITGTDGNITVTRVEWVTESACVATNGTENGAGNTTLTGTKSSSSAASAAPADTGAANTAGLCISAVMAGIISLLL